MSFALVVKFTLENETKAVAFDALVADTVRAIIDHEPGTLVYATYTVTDEPLARVFYEVYRDRAAFDEHERQPHTRHFLEQRGQYIESFRVEFLTPGVTKGLPA
ncbi:putative antibiotic biosynthesis monooxygenase [Nocardia nova SH22a]|uniref:Putative antibiotic biosynthesis monooxygenase n=1 Tax=Nocardia nova SH22a TaxID=1415166 RepID=W5TFI6_9NOCA|nr:antibiotic biosynthesis monooxygenase [Nocardia nova]AHH18120.1 putative antibiotic biosynthesis monooxygenase [Nocardia nova SH22a]